MTDKEKITQFITKNSSVMSEMADSIFDHPETGFQEHYAVKILTEWLQNHDFKTETGIGGLETAFRAVYENGFGGPSIGLLCEYDALPMGHACGHHMQGPVMLMTAWAIRNLVTEIPYKLVIYGTPAEEGPQGKRIMMENGCFRDIDLALMTHAAPNTTVDIKSLAGSTLQFTIKGVAAHEALMPEKTRSATDAVILAFQGIGLLRGHVKENVKFYSSIKECRGTPNNHDQTVARGEISIRTYQSEDLLELEERVRDVIQGAALMTGTTVKVEKTGGMPGKLPSCSLNRIIMGNAELLDAPQRLEYRTRTGSTDFSYVTRMMPGAVSRFAFVPEGSSSHSQIFLDYGKSEEAHRGMETGADILACTVYDLLTDPLLLTGVIEEYRERSAEKRIREK